MECTCELEYGYALTAKSEMTTGKKDWEVRLYGEGGSIDFSTREVTNEQASNSGLNVDTGNGIEGSGGVSLEVKVFAGFQPQVALEVIGKSVTIISTFLVTSSKTDLWPITLTRLSLGL